MTEDTCRVRRMSLTAPDRRRLFLWMAIVWLAAPVAVCQAQDTDQLRLYGALRLGTAFLPNAHPVSSAEAERVQQLTGLSVGVNLSRYLGVELAGDAFESDLRSADGRKLGEYGTFSLIPQLRLRYPLLDGMLTPYLLGGVGMGHNEFNDRKEPGIGRSIHARDTTVVGAFGAGIDYFIAKNLAVGVEVRYLVSRDQEIEIDGRTQRANVDALLTGASLRVLFPETPAADRPAGPDARTSGRFYLGPHLGGAVTIRDRILPGLKAEPVNSAIAGTLNPLFGVVAGANLTRVVGVELAADGYDFELAVPGLGSVGEYAVYTFIPQLRVRYPVLDGWMAPYLIAGVGVSYGEFKDRKPHGKDLDLEARDFSMVGAAGVGLEYFVASNIAVGLETRYVYSRNHSFRFAGRDRNADLDALLTTLGLRIYFGERAEKRSAVPAITARHRAPQRQRREASSPLSTWPAGRPAPRSAPCAATRPTLSR